MIKAETCCEHKARTMLVANEGLSCDFSLRDVTCLFLKFLMVITEPLKVDSQNIAVF
jgi:hypothetical protein